MRKSKLTKLALEALAQEFEVLESMEAKTFIGGGDLYAVFSRSEGVIYFYDDNGTLDASDDIFLYSGLAHNNVANGYNPWPNGTFEMLDQSSGHHHSNGDTTNGSYGTSGIYRALNFYDPDVDKTRTGMGIHSGRANQDFEDRVTYGCIRVEQSTMDKIDEYVNGGMKFKTITVKE